MISPEVQNKINFDRTSIVEDKDAGEIIIAGVLDTSIFSQAN